ncbi:MAG: TIGR00725 family protein, partial [bacterium]
GIARNAVNVHTSHAIIALEGGYGTLSEIAIALKAGKPVVSLGSWALDKIGCDSPLFHTASTPEEAVELAVRLAGENR